MAVSIQYLGHSAFHFTMEDGTHVLVDPFITGNPHIDISPDALPADQIFITHGHFDHVGDTVEIARRTGATVVGIYEVINYIQAQDPSIKTEAMNIGGEITFPWGSAVMVYSAHSSTLPDNTPGGQAAGFIFKTAGHKIYHSGDTGVCGELRFIGDYYKPNVALLPVGGRFTMGVEDLPRVIMWLGCDIVIPMHYGTFEPIEVDLDAVHFAVDHDTAAICKIIPPGESWSLAATEATGRSSGPESRY